MKEEQVADSLSGCSALNSTRCTYIHIVGHKGAFVAKGDDTDDQEGTHQVTAHRAFVIVFRQVLVQAVEEGAREFPDDVVHGKQETAQLDGDEGTAHGRGGIDEEAVVDQKETLVARETDFAQRVNVVVARQQLDRVREYRLQHVHERRWGRITNGSSQVVQEFVVLDENSATCHPHIQRYTRKTAPSSP